MVSPERLAALLVEAADTLIDQFDVTDFLQTMTSRTADLVDGSTACAFLADHQGRLQLVAASDEATRQVGLFQLQHQEGPGPDAFRTGRPVVNADLSAGVRWPLFAPHTSSRGLRSVHALPLRLRDDVLGALCLFGEQGRAFPPADVRAAQALAEVATIGLLQARAINRSAALAGQLQHALDSRMIIEQAKGALAQTHGVKVDEAFARLRTYARRNNHKLRDVAHRVVTAPDSDPTLTRPAQDHGPDTVLPALARSAILRSNARRKRPFKLTATQPGTVHKLQVRPAETPQTGSPTHAFLLVADRLPANPINLSATVGCGSQPDRCGPRAALEDATAGAVDGAWAGRPRGDEQAPHPVDVDGVHQVQVRLPATPIRDSYEEFANATLWPLYHDVVVAPRFSPQSWDAYVTVNERFAEIVAQQAAAKATVWVHDHRLQLVPDLMRRHRPDVRIGFFSHIPFPDYTIFAQLPWRRHILRGLLGADLIGFQRSADAANFLRACRHALGATPRGGVVPISDPRLRATGSRAPDATDLQGGPRQDRQVRVGVFPMSVDAARLDTLARRADVQARAVQIRHELADPRVVLLAVDPLDHAQGILHRLKAYEELLADGRLAPSGTVLVQVTVPSREPINEHQMLLRHLHKLVGRINGTHSALGRPAIHYLHHAYSSQELAALYRAADVMLVTPLRDGMNLVAKEYVACRYDDTGALVLSEFAGAADELASAFLVNPHDTDALKDTIIQAVTLNPRQARQRMRTMRKQVHTHDLHAWSSSFLDALHTTTVATHREPRVIYATEER